MQGFLIVTIIFTTFILDNKCLQKCLQSLFDHDDYRPLKQRSNPFFTSRMIQYCLVISTNTLQFYILLLNSNPLPTLISLLTLTCGQIGQFYHEWVSWKVNVDDICSCAVKLFFWSVFASSTGLTGNRIFTLGYCWTQFGLSGTSFYSVASSSLDSKHNSLLRAWPKACWCKWKNSYWLQWTLVCCLSKLKDITTT